MTDAPPVRRRLAGAALRRFREQAGCTIDDAARLLACDRSKISRIETGQRGIRPGELRDLLAGYGVDGPRRNGLLAIARHGRQAGWWQSGSHAADDGYHGLIGLAGAGTCVWAYDPQLVPALLQTGDYARAIAAASLIHESSDQREQFVRARLSWQQVLTREEEPLPFWAILGEGALRQMTGGRQVMRDQLRHLVDTGTGQPNVTVQVLPFAAGAHAAASGPFVVMRFAEAPGLGVVCLAGQTGGIYLEKPEEVARYTLAFEHLRASALSTAATVRLIGQVTAAL